MTSYQAASQTWAKYDSNSSNKPMASGGLAHGFNRYTLCIPWFVIIVDKLSKVLPYITKRREDLEAASQEQLQVQLSKLLRM